MFLTSDDYKSVCDDFEFAQIQDNAATRQQAEEAAMQMVASYTRDRYDMDAAFAQTGTDRDRMRV